MRIRPWVGGFSPPWIVYMGNFDPGWERNLVCYPDTYVQIDEMKMKDYLTYMGRQVTPPKRLTSPT